MKSHIWSKKHNGWVPIKYYIKRIGFWLLIIALFVTLGLATACSTAPCQPCPEKTDMQAALETLSDIVQPKVTWGCEC